MPIHSAAEVVRRFALSGASWSAALAAAFGIAAAAPAQVAGEAPHGRTALEIPITVQSLPRLVVNLRGEVLLDETRPGGSGLPGLRGPGCPVQVSSHTDANFGGGSFLMQAGFAEGEIAAASYTLPASAFPVKFELAEAVFATSAATVQTVTHWSIILYDGPPNSGAIVYEESSLDGILPPIILGPGTTATVVQVVVDPSDPEQVFFTNSLGSNTISVGFRIDEHNNQTSNPCLVGPPTNSNAFPVTDTSGLASAAGNWLFGLNCGLFGCPPNGGWTTFAGLGTLCRPSGDWVLRMNWSSVNCGPVEGACCLPSGVCEVRTPQSCQQAGGTYQGDGTTCAGINCPPPTGACCFGTGCLNLTESDCLDAQGTWLGAGTACSGGNSCPTGACCLPNGQCEISTQPACTAAGGIFRGVGTTCQSANCPQPSGACCLSTGGCLLLTEADCAVIPGSSWGGPGTTCVDANGNGRPDVCECPTDWTGEGLVNSADISAFLTAWIDSLNNQNLNADFNGDQVVNSADISAFLSAWIEDVTNGC